MTENLSKYNKVLHKRSVVALEDGTPKLPESNVLEYGEIAINYGDGHEALSFKSNNDSVVCFRPDKFYQTQFEGINKNIDSINGELTEVNLLIDENEEVIAAAITDLNDRLVNLENTSELDEGILNVNNLNYTQNGKNYPVVQDSNKNLYVNVEWTDENTTYSEATPTQSGLMSASDKEKLDTLTQYTHPIESGWKHIPSGGETGQLLGWESDGQAKWVDANFESTLNKSTVLDENSTDDQYPTSKVVYDEFETVKIKFNNNEKVIAAALADLDERLVTVENTEVGIDEEAVSALIQDKIGLLDSNVAVTGNSFVNVSVTQTDGKLTSINVNEKNIASASELSALTATVNNISTALTQTSNQVDTLIGDDEEKSVREIARLELAKQLIPESAKEALNSLEEIAAWIQQHPEDATTMNLNITELQSSVNSINDTIKDNEYVIAGAFNMLNKNISEITSDYLTSVNKEELLNNISDVAKNKQDNLVSGNNIKTINNQSILGPGNINVESLVKISYNELKELRDNSQLVPGMQYRITDYVTKAKSVDKSILATACEIGVENHIFDIIVTSDDVNILNENVRVIQHEGDEYFAKSNLASWELKYCIDNDTNRFMWADVDEGKGCIYFMKDEFDNECSYDFKNIKFKHNDVYYYTFHDVDTDGDASLNNIYCYSNIIEPNNPWGKYNLNGNIFTIGTDSYCYGNIFGLNCINIIIDSQGSGSFNNHFGHTCKDIVLGSGNYKNTFGDGCKNIVFGENCYKNLLDINSTNITFGIKCNDNTINSNSDNIIFGEGCVGNSIGMRNSTIEFGKNCNVNVIECYSKNIKLGDNCEANRLFGGENNKYLQKLKLETGSRYNTIDLCFNNSLTDTDEDSVIEGNSNTIGKMCTNINIKGTYNVIEDNCDTITLANNSKYNTVKSQCSIISMTKSLYNTIGKNCTNIVLGLECHSNTFGDSCYSNTFGDNCHSNTFGNHCYSNTFGEYCKFNTFDDYCYSNTFDNYCYSNTFGNYCYSNTFGEYCKFNTFDDYCYYNTFDNYCYSNTFDTYCYSNTFGNSCYSNTFGNDCHSNTFGKSCFYNAFGEYCYSNTFGDSCYSNTFDNYCGSNTFGTYCQSNTFGIYCYSNTFGDNCHSNTFGNSCQSNTFGLSENSPKSYYKYIIFDNGNKYINLNCTETTSSSKYYQNVRIGLGVNNTSTYKTIDDGNVGQTYETKIAKNSAGEIKMYCEADLIA